MAALGALVLGCLGDTSIPCGDRVCPAGTACVDETAGGRCVSEGLVEACDGRAEGDACELAGIAGLCRGGICVGPGCGNGEVDPGEVCDDGNTTSGDGCRADCQGLERCGDGFRDVAETCDCGDDPLALPAGCATVNDDAPTAQCDTACSRFCGDGVVTGGEQCDGPALGGAGCADLGFYAGDLACTPQCIFDDAACTGTCGDGMIQSPEEACDGAPPENSCVDFGYDEGHLGCTTRCTADLRNDCTRLGWSLLTTATSAWTDGDLAALAGVHGVLVTSDGALLEVTDHAVQRVVGQDGVVWFVGERTSTRWEAGATTTVAMPAVGGADFTAIDAAIDASGHLVVLSEVPCELWRLDGATWTPQLSLPSSHCIGLGATDGDRIVVQDDFGNVLEWDGAAFQPVATVGAVADLAIIDGKLGVASSAGLYLDGVTLRTGPYTSIAGADDLLVGVQASGTIDRWDGVGWTALPPPPTGIHQVAVAGSGALVGVPLSALSPAARLAEGIWRQESVSGSSSPTGVLRTGDGAVIVGSHVAVYGPTTWAVSPTGVSSVSVWGTTIERFWVVASGNLRRYDDRDLANPVLLTGPWTAGTVLRVSGADDGTPALVTSTALYRDVDGLWEDTPAPIGCSLGNLAGGVAPALYAIGVCGGEPVLWQHDGAQLVERYRGAGGQSLSALTLTADGGVSAIGSAMVRVELAGGAAVVTSGAGIAITGQAADDLYAVRANFPAPGSNALMHWDGTSWAPIRPPILSPWRAVARGADDLLLYGASNVQRLTWVRR
ncbi:MAG: hypothetical protein R2939_16225 [Kofleriaceae bacterium]